MLQIDFNLTGTALLDERVNLKSLRLGKVIDRVNHRAVFIHRSHRKHLTSGATSPGPTNRRFNRLVWINVWLGQIKFQLRCNHRAQAFGIIKLQHPAQDRAWRDIKVAPFTQFQITDDLKRRVIRPRHRRGCAHVWHDHNVLFRPLVFDIHIDVFARDRLIKQRDRQIKALIRAEFVRRHRLAARGARKVRHNAFHLFKPPPIQVAAESRWQRIAPICGVCVCLSHDRLRV